VSRVLPFDKPSWDYALWNELRLKAALITEEQLSYISRKDIGPSKSARQVRAERSRNENRSSLFTEFWTGEGRKTTPRSENLVIDFIGLSRGFDDWFTRVNLDKEGLVDEISDHVSRLNGGNHLEDLGEEWAEINWPIIGRVIGAAIAIEGKRERWWPYSGSDAQISNSFWGEMERNSVRGSGFRSTDSETWEKMVDTYRYNSDFDPSEELHRSASHRPSAPIIVYGSEYVMNPLTFRHRERMRGRFRDREDAEEISIFHGQLTFQAIREAMDSLKGQNAVGFALGINGICSSHIMRSNLLQQKIGMHLFTNLAIRRRTRGVEAMNVPDIADALSTSFSLGKVLKILYEAGLIEWYTVEKDDVHQTISDLKSRG